MKQSIEGDRAYGRNVVLLKQDDDLIAQTSWAEQGYHVASFLPEAVYQQFMAGVKNLFAAFLQKANVHYGSELLLENYHQWIGNDYELHLAVINQSKLIETKHFPIDVSLIENCVSELCKVHVQAKNPFNGEEVFHFRVIRPQSTDNNPLHRDVWLEEYHDCVNIYVPICGSNARSSLTLVPGSHYWSEADVEKTVSGAKVNGIQFNVPAVTGSRQALNTIRPNPGKNEVLVFSPYLLHGGATNMNEDITRISLEMRFWRKK